MRSISTLALGLLAASAWAAPGAEPNAKQKKDVCNADNCLRAVRATSAKPFASSATADCSSFMRKTVTPCAATSTATTTVTVTAPITSVTVTATAVQTQLNTVVQSLTSVATIEDTLTLIQPTEVQVVNTVLTVVTVTQVQAKRGIDAKPLPVLPTALDRARKRAVTTSPGSAPTCPATTNAPTKTPTYASACSGTVRYSSACSCAGVTATTTTVPRSTVTTTTTSTVTYTPTATLTATITNNVPITIVQTQVVPATFETTDATLVIPSAYTVTSDLVVATTVAVAPPVCSSYKFVATDGEYAGQFLTGGTPDPNAISYGFVQFDTPANAMTFTLRPDGTVYGGNNVYGWVTDSESLYYVLQMTDRSASVYQVVSHLTCVIGNGDTSYPGAVGTLSCSAYGHPVDLVYSDSVGNYLLQESDYQGGGTTVVEFAAIPAC